MKYKHCNQELKAVRGKGWVHQGGSAYMQKCKNCDWEYTGPEIVITCPKCEGKVYDDHRAEPQWEE